MTLYDQLLRVADPAADRLLGPIQLASSRLGAIGRPQSWRCAKAGVKATMGP